METYTLIFSTLLKNKKYIPYDIILYKNELFGGLDLFKNFIYAFNDKNSNYPIKRFNSYYEAKNYYRSL